ncbi:MAG TPA: thiol-activated cytolysin family protein [Saprospiraceae bacterium]|nr:thiol-activated cytolysin family protein [Saprospiraceae bacterium]HPI06608.1 thiol-activated cytolysin family protein [Saprospiraceae bacterium]
MKKVIAALGGLFALTLFFACKMTLSGHVARKDTNVPIPNAGIRVLDKKAVTDGSGNYAVKLPKSVLKNPVPITAEATGFQPQTKPTGAKTVDFALTPAFVPPPPPACDFKTQISRLPGVLKPADAKGRQESNVQTAEVPMGNEFVLQTTKDVFLEKNFSQLILFNPNSDVIWPGALVRYSSVKAGIPALINVPRNPVNIWINLSNTSRNIRKENVEPRGGTVQSAINEILSNDANKNGYTALMDFDRVESYQTSQLATYFNFEAKWLSGSVSNLFNSTSQGEKKIVVVKFLQNYYKAVYDPPVNGNADMFSAMDELTCSSTFDAADIPCYISEVNYGRMIYFKIESSSSFTEIKDKLTASYKAVSVEASLQSVNTLKDLHITAYIGGGSPGDGVKAITSNEFATLIRSNPVPSAQSPGIPLSYIVKDLKNNTVAMQTNSQFTEYNTTPLKRKIRVFLEKMHVEDDGDNLSAGDFIWKITANGAVVSEQGNLANGEHNTQISSGRDFNFNGVSVDLELPYNRSEKVRFTADITEVDGGLGGGNDVIPTIRDEIYVTDFPNTMAPKKVINKQIRGHLNRSPDVTLYFRYELIGTYPAY